MPTKKRPETRSDCERLRYRGYRKRIYGTKHERNVERREWEASIDKMLGAPTTQQGGRRKYLTSVGQCVDTFLSYTKRTAAEKTYLFYLYPCEHLKAYMGADFPVVELARHHIEEWHSKHWLYKQPTKRNPETDNPTSPNTRNKYRRTVKRCFKWCVDVGHLTAHPFPTLKIGTYVPCRTHVTDDQFKMVLENWSRDRNFLDYLLFLRFTGARVQEARLVEAHQVDRQGCRIVMQNKTEEKTEVKRIILLNSVALPIVEKHMLRNPEGPLFRNSDGKPWTTSAVNCRFQRAHYHGKLPFLAAQKNLRHSWATEALKGNKIDVATAAALMGHSNPMMILKYYQHIIDELDHLRTSIEKVDGSQFNLDGPRLAEVG